MTRRWYWKLYLLLITALNIGGFGLLFYFSEEIEITSLEHIAEWAALPIYLVQLVGLFGFVYWRRIGSPLLWKLVFAVTILDLLWQGYSFAIDATGFADTGIAVFVIMVIVAVAISLPLLAALYIYAFRSNNLWARAS